MIRDVFLPERIGSHYLFAKRVLALEICKNHINATIVRLRGSRRIIEQCEQERIESQGNNNYQERASQALTALLQRCKRYDEVRVTIQSSLAVFKELRFPFADREKISMVINFEVEPLLPFPLATAVVDFIITGVSSQKEAQVLAAAVQKQHVRNVQTILEASQIHADVVSIDLFALYDLYTQIPAYESLELVTLIDLEPHATRIMRIEQGQLRHIRTLPRGLSHLVKNISEALNIPSAQAFDNLMRFGLYKEDQPTYNDAAATTFGSFWKEIQFTLASIGSKDPLTGKMLLLGEGASIKNLIEHIATMYQVSAEIFDPNLILAQKEISLASGMHTIPLSASMSLGLALTQKTDGFNLQQDDLESADNTLLAKQLIVGLLLTLSLFGILITHYVVQVSTLKREVGTSSREALDALRERFKDIDDTTNTLTDDVVETAQDELKREEDTWFKFSPQARPTFLKILLELTDRIDKDALGFSLDQLTITEGSVVAKGRVKDFEALKLLEKEIAQSKLLTLVPPTPQEPEFTMRLRVVPPSREGL